MNAYALKPTKAARAAAPDLFGHPAYVNESSHHEALIYQLKALGMFPAAWAIEDTQLRVIEFDAMVERIEELEDYKTFFGAVVAALENARGRWPAAKPDDGTLLAAISEDLEKAATARRVEEFESESAD